MHNGTDSCYRCGCKVYNEDDIYCSECKEDDV